MKAWTEESSNKGSPDGGTMRGMDAVLVGTFELNNTKSEGHWVAVRSVQMDGGLAKHWAAEKLRRRKLGGREAGTQEGKFVWPDRRRGTIM